LYHHYTAVVHRFRLVDAAPARALALDAIKAAAASPGDTVGLALFTLLFCSQNTRRSAIAS
jgi:hypothetical protein